MTLLNRLNIWVVSEGIAGTENQCLGITDALGVTPVVKRIQLNQPWKTLSPYLPFEQKWSFSKKGDPLQPPWPHMVIAAGRKSIAGAFYIKKKNWQQNRKKTWLIQIQDPRVSARHFDLVAVPQHDPLRTKNVIVTDGSPNRITEKLLRQEKEKFKNLFSGLPDQKILFAIGGKSKDYEMLEEDIDSLIQEMMRLSESYGLMVTISRRTGIENTQKIKEALAQKKNCFFWDGQGQGQVQNPYHAMLGWADYIVVTADSASMISDAATTGKPVYIYALTGGHERRGKMHNHMINIGAARFYDGHIQGWEYSPLNDAQKVSDEIKRRFLQNLPV